MAILENLVVKLSGDSRGLVRTTRVGIRALGRLGRAAKGIATRIGGFGLLAGGVGGVGFGAVFNNMAQGIDRIGKRSREFGLTVDQIQRLERLASLGGTSFDTLGRGLRFAARAGAQALRDLEAGKVTETTKAFERLGISGNQIERGLKRPIEFLQILARQLLKVEDPGQRLAELQLVLGSRSTELAAALPGLIKGFKDLDGAFPRGDVLTGLDVKDVEDYNDAVTNLAGTFKQITRSAVSALAPAAEALTESSAKRLRGFLDRFGGARGAGRELGAGVLGALGGATEIVGRMLNAFTIGPRLSLNALRGGTLGVPSPAPFEEGSATQALEGFIDEALRGTVREQELEELRRQTSLQEAIVVNLKTGQPVVLR